MSDNIARLFADSARDFSDATIIKRCIFRVLICRSNVSSRLPAVGRGADVVEGLRALWVEVRRQTTVASEGSDRGEEVAMIGASLAGSGRAGKCGQVGRCSAVGG